VYRQALTAFERRTSNKLRSPLRGRGHASSHSVVHYATFHDLCLPVPMPCQNASPLSCTWACHVPNLDRLYQYGDQIYGETVSDRGCIRGVVSQRWSHRLIFQWKEATAAKLAHIVFHGCLPILMGRTIHLGRKNICGFERLHMQRW
jgi:hypothetical protein